MFYNPAMLHSPDFSTAVKACTYTRVHAGVCFHCVTVHVSAVDTHLAEHLPHPLAVIELDLEQLAVSGTGDKVV